MKGISIKIKFMKMKIIIENGFDRAYHISTVGRAVVRTLDHRGVIVVLHRDRQAAGLT